MLATTQNSAEGFNSKAGFQSSMAMEPAASPAGSEASVCNDRCDLSSSSPVFALTGMGRVSSVASDLSTMSAYQHEPQQKRVRHEERGIQDITQMGAGDGGGLAGPGPSAAAAAHGRSVAHHHVNHPPPPVGGMPVPFQCHGGGATGVPLMPTFLRGMPAFFPAALQWAPVDLARTATVLGAPVCYDPRAPTVAMPAVMPSAAVQGHVVGVGPTVLPARTMAAPGEARRKRKHGDRVEGASPTTPPQPSVARAAQGGCGPSARGAADEVWVDRRVRHWLDALGIRAEVRGAVSGLAGHLWQRTAVVLDRKFERSGGGGGAGGAAAASSSRSKGGCGGRHEKGGWRAAGELVLGACMWLAIKLEDRGGDERLESCVTVSVRMGLLPRALLNMERAVCMHLGFRLLEGWMAPAAAGEERRGSSAPR